MPLVDRPLLDQWCWEDVLGDGGGLCWCGLDADRVGKGRME